MSDAQTLKELDLDAIATSVLSALAQHGLNDVPLDKTLRRTLKPVADLDEAVVKELLENPTGLELMGTLGEGGMGVVYAARETALCRTVAVKTLRGSPRPEAVRALLHEAWVTGRVEHPHVLPVYRLGVDEKGVPRLVLKRVQGVTWESVMHDPQTIEQRFGTSDTLGFNLRVLLQVCQAVRLAHDRGVVHRDIKPANVMLGTYGEVYLIDWGVATVAVGQATAPPMGALDDKAAGLAGTICYMAPEQFRMGMPSPATDIYLLGATLFDLVVGRPPHDASTLRDALASSLSSPPPVPGHVARPLADIITRAMQQQVADRYLDVGAFERALTDFLERRAAHRAVEEAELSLTDLKHRAAAFKAGLADAGVMPQLYRLYGESRFGFLRAQEHFADLPDTDEGLLEATEVMVDVELARGEPMAAMALLAQLPKPAPALQARVDAQLRHRSLEQGKVAEALSQVDPRTGQPARRAIIITLGALWVVGPLLVGLVNGGLPQNPLLRAAASALQLAVLIGAVGANWRRLGSLLNRQMAAAAILAVGAQLTLHLGGVLSGEPADAAARTQFIPWLALCGAMALSVSRSFWLPATGYLAASLTTALFPRLFLGCLVLSNLLLFVVLMMRFWSVGRRR